MAQQMRNTTLTHFVETVTAGIDKIGNPLLQSSCREEMDFFNKNNMLSDLFRLHSIIHLLRRADIPFAHQSSPVLTSTLFHHLGLHPVLPQTLDLQFSDWLHDKQAFTPWTLFVREQDLDRIATLPMLEISERSRRHRSIRARISRSLSVRGKYVATEQREYRDKPDITFIADDGFTLLSRANRTIESDPVFRHPASPVRITRFPGRNIPGFPLSSMREQTLSALSPLNFRTFHNVLLCPEIKLSGYPTSFCFDYPKIFLQNCTGLLEESRGLLLFREQIVEIISALTGYRLQTVLDFVQLMRKGKHLSELREEFMEDCRKNSTLDRKKSALIWNRLHMELPATVSRTKNLGNNLLRWRLLKLYQNDPETLELLAAQKD